MKPIKTLLFMFILSFQLFPLQASAEEVKKAEIIVTELKEYTIRLEEQNKILLSANIDIRNSYYWALGFCATFLILFLGVNIYFFRNRFDEDKEFLINKINVKAKQIEIDNKNLIDNEIIKLDNKLEASFKQKASELTKTYKSTVSLNRNEIQRLRVDITELELENTKAGGCNPNILTKYLKLAEETQKLEDKHYYWKISRCLLEIKKLLDEGVKIDSMDYTETITFLSSLPNEFDDVVKEIRKHLIPVE